MSGNGAGLSELIWLIEYFFQYPLNTSTYQVDVTPHIQTFRETRFTEMLAAGEAIILHTVPACGFCF